MKRIVQPALLRISCYRSCQVQATGGGQQRGAQRLLAAERGSTNGGIVNQMDDTRPWLMCSRRIKCASEPPCPIAATNCSGGFLKFWPLLPASHQATHQSSPKCSRSRDISNRSVRIILYFQSVDRHAGTRIHAGLQLFPREQRGKAHPSIFRPPTRGER